MKNPGLICRWLLLLAAVFTLLVSPGRVSAGQAGYVLVQASNVNAGGRTLTLPKGQALDVLGIEGGLATVRITLADGSLSIAQLPAGLLQKAVPQSAPPVMAQLSTSAPAASATPSPADTPVSSQFQLNPGTASTTGTGESQTVHKDWKLVWSDEFNGDSLDTSKWSFEVNGKGGGNGEKQYYTDRPKNAHLEDGCLVITARKEKYKGPDGTREYTSARLTTQGKAEWKYGRFEARIKFPKGKGYWPAFWMMPADSVYGGWARSGEIDIAEVIGNKPNILYGTIHYGDSWPRNVHTGDKIALPSGDFSDDFHVIAIEWEQGVIRWYLDDKLYQTQTQWRSAGGPYPAPFDQKFFIILNVAVGGAWPGPPAPDTVFPQSMKVDYVRVYQPAGAGS